MPIHTLIVDDHPLMALGIKDALSLDDDINVLAVLENGQEALNFLKNIPADVVLLDIDMPILNGIETAKQIIAKYTNTKIAMLSMHKEASIIKELVEIGVKGYMLKTIPKEDLIQGIKTIYKGKHYFNSDVTKELLINKSVSKLTVETKEKSPLLNSLTPREIEIIIAISNGFTNNQIGKKLFISPRTVDTHRTNIMKKLEVHNVASLIRFAFQNGLTS
ncbi:response regulator [Polaribacter sp. M15]